ncbi:hypothetical protein [Parasphingorhabdus sp.]|uniref:hypothetical protein n=1 Tax=Parasphingorhabdus sp. TaxID=2709688 RepID=UPI003A935858
MAKTTFLLRTYSEHSLFIDKVGKIHDCFGQLVSNFTGCDHREHFFIHLGSPEETVTFVAEERLVGMAFDALEQVLALSTEERVCRTRSIAVCLAYLASRNASERWPFDEFWKWLECEDKYTRSGNLNRCLNGIYAQLGIRRTNEEIFKYKRTVDLHL